MKRFFILQFTILALAMFNGSRWINEQNFRSRLPALNESPRVISPEFNYDFVISNEQLREVLFKLRPKFEQQPTKINYIDHALRLWGDSIVFDDCVYNGPRMRETLLDHRLFEKGWGTSAPPLLKIVDDGISVITQEGRSTVSHVDHLVGTLAEIGVALSHPVVTKNGTGCVRDMINYGLTNFQLNQKEYEWTALAAAFFVVDGSSWFSNEGQAIDFNVLAQRTMRQKQPLGVCYGQHRLYTLTMLLRIDEQIQSRGEAPGLFDPVTRAEVISYLSDMTRRFHRNQALAGYWDGNWPNTREQVPDPTTDELSRRILATGHALEWWAMAPRELHPPRETIVRAAQWLTKQIIEMDDRLIEKNYTFLTHAARALALWRGETPDKIFLQLNPDLGNGIRNSPKGLQNAS